LHSYFLRFRFIWTQTSSTLTFCFWIMQETPNFFARYNPFSNISVINHLKKRSLMFLIRR
jgi:hypothetical protein